MQLASNYLKLFEITTIWIKFWFKYLRIALGIQIKKIDSNSDIWLKTEYIWLFNWNYLIDFNQNRPILIEID